MEQLGIILLLFVVALIIGVVINKRTAATALEGVSFVLAYPPSLVAAALDKTHNKGTAAAIRGAFGGVSVVAVANKAFAYQSKFGDQGQIVITSDPAGAHVQARTTNLYVGAPQKMLNTSSTGIWALSVAITHGLYRLAGVTPGAANMKRWQNALQGRVTREITKATA